MHSYSLQDMAWETIPALWGMQYATTVDEVVAEAATMFAAEAMEAMPELVTKVATSPSTVHFADTSHRLPLSTGQARCAAPSSYS